MKRRVASFLSRFWRGKHSPLQEFNALPSSLNATAFPFLFPLYFVRDAGLSDFICLRYLWMVKSTARRATTGKPRGSQRLSSDPLTLFCTLAPFPPCWPSRSCVTRIIFVAAPLKCQYLSSELSSTVLLCFRHLLSTRSNLYLVPGHCFKHQVFDSVEDKAA